MGHNSMVSGHLKSIKISQVNGLSTGPSNLGCHMIRTTKSIFIQNISNA